MQCEHKRSFFSGGALMNLVEEGKRVWAEQASAPTLAAIKMRSRITEAEALLDETGLGNFTVSGVD
jgi:hypothetical protein